MESSRKIKKWLLAKQPLYATATKDYSKRLSSALDTATKLNLNEQRAFRCGIVQVQDTKLVTTLDGRQMLQITGLEPALSWLCLNEYVRMTIIHQTPNNRPQLEVASDINASDADAADARTQLQTTTANADYNQDDIRVVRVDSISLEQICVEILNFAIDKDELSADTHLKFESLSSEMLVLNRFKRISQALKRFEAIQCSTRIHRCLLANYISWNNDKHLKARLKFITLQCLDLKLDQLDSWQQWAMIHAMTKKVTLIEGVAGSGKTFLASYVACAMTRCRNKRVLLSSPILSGVNKLAKFVAKSAGLCVVRYKEFDDEDGDENDEKVKDDNDLKLVDLNELILKSPLNSSKKTKRTLESKIRQIDAAEHLQSPLKKSALSLRRKLRISMLQRADIVCATTIEAGSAEMRKSGAFDLLIIDDAHFATEADCLVALMTDVSQVVLIGDFRRDIRFNRSPTLSSSTAVTTIAASKEIIIPISIEEGNPIRHTNSLMHHSRPSSVEIRSDDRKASNKLQKEATNKKTNSKAKNQESKDPAINPVEDKGGLFERWIELGIPTICLTNQYRMNKELTKVPSQLFYVNHMRTTKSTRLKFEALKPENSEHQHTPWLPTALFDSKSEDDAFSCLTNHLLQHLTKRDMVKKSNIVIVNSCYSQKLSAKLSLHEALRGIRVTTIDKMIGQETDYVILTCFGDGSNGGRLDPKSIVNNFTRNDSALNVALTRAKLGLFVIFALSQLKYSSASWKFLVDFYKTNQLIAYTY